MFTMDLFSLLMAWITDYVLVKVLRNIVLLEYRNVFDLGTQIKELKAIGINSENIISNICMDLVEELLIDQLMI